MSGSAGPLVPTFNGFVHNTMDGLILFEACLSGKLHHVPRRPHDRERASLIRSGSIFIYEENASGIKRWTDGVAWSPSRILGNFLIYRELEKPFPPGEKKRAIKRKRASIPGEPYPRRQSDDNESSDLTTPLDPHSPRPGGDAKSEGPSTDQDKELERSLIGSLVDSYGFRPDGLVKKTMSVLVNGISHHMVSYYKVEDVKNNLLPRPLTDPRLQNISVRPDLYLKQNFRAPVEETEHYAIDGHMHAHPPSMYSTMAGGYGSRPGQYMGQSYGGQVYGLPTSSASNVYGGMTGTSWPNHQAPSGAMGYGNRSYAGQNYSPGYYGSAASASTTPALKADEHQGSPATSTYANHYNNINYASMPRSGSQSAPNMMQSAYQTPVQPSSSSFGSMSAPNGGRSSYGVVMENQSTHAPSQQNYTTAGSQQYPVRSPAQVYTVHSAPNGAVAHSPTAGMKSPHQLGAVSDPNAHMPYRPQSYQVPAQQSASQGDMTGLGIAGSSSYAAPGQHVQSYAGYAPPGQAFRGVGEALPGGAAQYSQ